MIDIHCGSLVEATTIKNLLEHENIHVFVANELMSSIESVAVSSGGFGSVVLRVDSVDVARASKIVEDYQNGNLSLGF